MNPESKPSSCSSSKSEAKTSVLSCNICNKNFSTKDGLRTHLNIHDETKAFKCEICTTAFSKKSHLVQHALIHRGTKPYICSVCNRGFNRPANLTRHAKVHKLHLQSAQQYLPTIEQWAGNCGQAQQVDGQQQPWVDSGVQGMSYYGETMDNSEQSYPGAPGEGSVQQWLEVYTPDSSPGSLHSTNSYPESRGQMMGDDHGCPPTSVEVDVGNIVAYLSDMESPSSIGSVEKGAWCGDQCAMVHPLPDPLPLLPSLAHTMPHSFYRTPQINAHFHESPGPQGSGWPSTAAETVSLQLQKLETQLSSE